MRKSLVLGLSSIIVMSVLASGCAPQRRQPSPDVKKAGKGAPATSGQQDVSGNDNKSTAPTAPGLSNEMSKQPEVEKLEGLPLDVTSIYRTNESQRQSDGTYTGDAGFQISVVGEDKPILIKISDAEKKGAGDIIVENNRLKGGFVCTDMDGLKKGITQCSNLNVKITEMDGKTVNLDIEDISKGPIKVDVSVEAKALVNRAVAVSSLTAIKDNKSGRKTFLTNYIKLNDGKGVLADARASDKRTLSRIHGLPEKTQDGKAITYEKGTDSLLTNAIGSVVSEGTITTHNVTLTIEGEKPVVASFTIDRNSDVDMSLVGSGSDKANAPSGSAVTVPTPAPVPAPAPGAAPESSASGTTQTVDTTTVTADGQPPAPAVGGAPRAKTPAEIAAEKAAVDKRAQELAQKQADDKKAAEEAAAKKAADQAAADKKSADESAASIPYGTALLNGTVQMLTHPLNFFFGW